MHNIIALRMRSVLAIVCKVWKQALEAFHNLGTHNLGRQHAVDADQAQRKSFYNGGLLTVYILMQPETVTCQTRGRCVHRIFWIKPLLEIFWR